MFYHNITTARTYLHKLPYNPELLVFKRKETRTHIFFYPDTKLSVSLMPSYNRSDSIRLIKDVKITIERMLEHLNKYPGFHLIHPLV